MNVEQICKLIDPDEVIDVVKDMVNIKSVIPPHSVEEEMGNYVIDYMESKGVNVKTQEIGPGRFNVICKVEGEKSIPSIMFTGHLDTVPVSQNEINLWKTNPFQAEIIGDKLYGRGSADMKGGLGAAMVALGALSSHKITPACDIVLLATADEEGMMLGSKAIVHTPFTENVKKLVVCEPTDMEIVTICKGRTWADMKVFGEAAHASGENAGINAIDKATILMNRLAQYNIPYEPHSVVGNSFWQVTEINGGMGPAIIPDQCTFTLDARLVPGQTTKDIWSDVEKIIESLKKEDPDFKAEINVIEERDPWETTKTDLFVKNMENSIKSLGLPIVYAGCLGTTDGTVLRKAGMDSIIFGPGDITLAHKENENVSITQLIQAAQVYLHSMISWKG